MLIKHRHLILRLTKDLVLSQYKNSFLGWFWTLLQPLFFLAIYTFVFSFVFQAKWGTADQSKGEFAIVLFCGLTIFALFSDAVATAPSLVAQRAFLVKKIAFPIQILPYVLVASALFRFAQSFIVLTLGYFFVYGAPHLAWLWIPVISLPLILTTLAATYALSSLGVYLRDLEQFAPLMTTLLLFLSPIFYPIDAVPPKFQQVLLLNPLSFLVEMFRNAYIWGESPPLVGMSVAILVSYMLYRASVHLFQSIKGGFADVL